MKTKLLLAIIFFSSLFFLGAKKSLATHAQLACSPTTSTLEVGETITTDIILNTRSYKVTGAYPILTYTSTILDASSATLEAVTEDTGWSAPTKKTVDATTGKIEVDYGKTQDEFTSTGTIARVTFTAKKAGNANINFVFFSEYDDTTAGVAKVWGEKTAGVTSNILTDIVDCAYTVTGEEETTPSPTLPPGVSPTSRPTSLPKTGTWEVTMGIVVAGIMVTLGGWAMKRVY